MSKKARKKSTRRLSKSGRDDRSSRKGRQRLLIAMIGLALSVCILSGGVTGLGGLRHATEGVKNWLGARPLPTPTPDSFAPTNPAKEYIYAGDRLVATEEHTPPIPAAPTGLQIMWCDRYITWTDNSDNESGFKIERSYDGSSFENYTIVPANQSNFWLSRHYQNAYFRVRATNGGGDSEVSNVVLHHGCAPSSPEANQINAGCNPTTCPEGTPSSPDTIWVDDDLPTGANPAGEEPWNWVSADPIPFSGSSSNQSAVMAGAHQHYFNSATETLTVNAGETLIAYVYLDPANLPSEIMMQWSDGSWEHRAYWGANNLNWGVDGTNSRRYIGPLPGAGQWRRLEVPASQVGLQGSTLSGLALTLFGGRANWDYIGKSTQNSSGNTVAPPTGLIATAGSGSQINLTWNAPAGTVHHYQVERAQSTGAGFALISSNVAVAAFSDTSVNSGTSYVYRVCAVDAAGNHSAYSNVDLATAISFTDEPLTPGTTTIRAQHISELRQAVSAVRTLAGLSAVTWTDPSLSGVTIKAVHIQEMRISLDEALSSLGLPASSYTDSSLTGIAVKKVHVDELRQRVR